LKDSYKTDTFKKRVINSADKDFDKSSVTVCPNSDMQPPGTD